jgi:hypothetical protein
MSVTPDEIDGDAEQAVEQQDQPAVTVPPEDQVPVQPVPEAEPTPVQPAVPTLKVELPHSSFTYGGVTIWGTPTEVHPSLIPPIMQSAAEAGVTLTQEG